MSATGAQTGLSGSEQIIIALRTIESLGGVAQMQDIYRAVENHLGGNELSDQGKASLRRLISHEAVRAGYLFPYDADNPGWRITNKGRQFIRDREGNNASQLQGRGREQKVRGIPIEALGLSIRVYNALRRAGIATIEQLAQLQDEDILAIRNIGSLAFQEIREKLRGILPEILEGSEQSEHGILSAHCMAWEREPLASLKLNAATLTALKRSGITTVAELIRAILGLGGELSRVVGVGPRRRLEIYERIAEFELNQPINPSHFEGGKVSIQNLNLTTEARSYIESLGIGSFPVLYHRMRDKPSHGSRKEEILQIEIRAKMIAYVALLAWESETGRDLFEEPDRQGALIEDEEEDAHPWLDEDGLALLFTGWMDSLGPRQQVVLNKRYGLNGEKMTLQEIGEELGVTRERVRQLQARALRKFERAILASCYGDMAHHNPSAKGLSLSPLYKLLSTYVQFGIREDHLYELVKRELQIDLSLRENRNGLILRAMKYARVGFRKEALAPIWCNERSVDKTELRLAVEMIDRLLTRDHTNPMSEAALLTEAIANGLAPSLRSPETFRKCLELCSTIEEYGVGIFQGKFEHLQRWRDQAERILRARREPLHYKQIAQEIIEKSESVKKKQVGIRHIVNEMARDDRFVPIGKSGYWALKEWGVEQGKILDLMKKCLEEQGRPLTQDEIYYYVDDRRPVSESSIALYLGNSEEFVKVGLDEWALSSWPEAKELKTWDALGVAEYIEEVFTEQGVSIMTFAELRERLLAAAGVTARRAQGMLNQSLAIRTYRTAIGGELMAEFQPDYRELLEKRAQRPRKKETLGHRIARIVRDILEDAPDGCLTLREIVDHLVVELERPRHTFYGYISKFEFIEKTEDETSGRIVVCLIESENQRKG